MGYTIGHVSRVTWVCVIKVAHISALDQCVNMYISYFLVIFNLNCRQILKSLTTCLQFSNQNVLYFLDSSFSKRLQNFPFIDNTYIHTYNNIPHTKIMIRSLENYIAII